MNNSITQRVSQLLKSNQRFISFADYFVELFGIENLIKECGGIQNTGIAYVRIFRYLLTLTFYGVSHYRDLRDGHLNPGFSYATLNRFLNNPKINWLELTSRLSYKIFRYLRPNWDPERDKLYFIIDDTSYKRPYAVYVQDISWQKDHIDNRNYKGFRYNVLSINCRDLILPVNGVFVSSTNRDKLLYPEDHLSGSYPQMLDKLATEKMTQVLLFQEKLALRAGFRPDGSIFDTWYTWPKTVSDVMDLESDVVGALKNSKTRYLYEGEELRIGEIFKRLLKDHPLPDKDGIFFAPVVQARYGGKTFPLKLVFAENVNPTREYFCLASTLIDCPSKEIVEIYRFRWSLETIFKDLKNETLGLNSGAKALSLTGIYAYSSIVLCRYMMLITEREIDHRQDRSVQDQYHACRREQLAVDSANTLLDLLNEAVPGLAKKFHSSPGEVREALADALAGSKNFEKIWSQLPSCNFTKKPTH